MNSFKYFVLITFVLCLVPVLAIELNIKVIDSQIQIPVENAQIQIWPSLDSIPRDPITDCNGFAYFDLPRGTYTVTVIKSNVRESRTINLNANANLIIPLRAENKIEVFVVSNGRVNVYRNSCLKTSTSNYVLINNFYTDTIELEAIPSTGYRFSMFSFYIGNINVRNDTNQRVSFRADNYKIFAIFVPQDFTREDVERLFALANNIISKLDNIEQKTDQIIKLLNELNNVEQTKFREIINLLNVLLSKTDRMDSKLEQIIELIRQLSQVSEEKFREIINLLRVISAKEDAIVVILNELKTINSASYLSLLSEIRNIRAYINDNLLTYPIQTSEEEKHCLIFNKIENLYLKAGLNEFVIFIENCGNFVERNISVILNFLDQVYISGIEKLMPNEVKSIRYRIFVPYDLLQAEAKIFAYNAYNKIEAGFFVYKISSNIKVEVPSSVEKEFYISIKNIGLKTEKVKIDVKARNVVLMPEERDFEVLPNQEKKIRIDVFIPENVNEETVKLTVNEKEFLIKVARQIEVKANIAKTFLEIKIDLLTITIIIAIVAAIVFILYRSIVKRFSVPESF